MVAAVMSKELPHACRPHPDFISGSGVQDIRSIYRAPITVSYVIKNLPRTPSNQLWPLWGQGDYFLPKLIGHYSNQGIYIMTPGHVTLRSGSKTPISIKLWSCDLTLMLPAEAGTQTTIELRPS